MKYLIVLALVSALSLQIQLTCSIKIKKMTRNQVAKKSLEAFTARITSNTFKKLKKKDTFTTRMKSALKEVEGIIFKDDKSNFYHFIKNSPIERTPEEFLKFKGTRRVKAEMLSRRVVRKELRESRERSQNAQLEESTDDNFVLADSGDENPDAKNQASLTDAEIEEENQKQKEDILVQKKIDKLASSVFNGDLSAEEEMSAKLQNNEEDSTNTSVETKDLNRGTENDESDNENKDDDNDGSFEGAMKGEDSGRGERQNSIDLLSRRLTLRRRNKGRLLSVVELKTTPRLPKLVKMSPRRLSVIDEILSGNWHMSRRFSKAVKVKVFQVHFRCSYDSLVAREGAEEVNAPADYQTESLINCSAKDHTMLHVIFSDKIGSEQNRFPLNSDSNPFMIEKHSFRVVISEHNIFPKIFVDERSCLVHVLSGAWLVRAVWAIALLLGFWGRW